jgi:hypothetical protein
MPPGALGLVTWYHPSRESMRESGKSSVRICGAKIPAASFFSRVHAVTRRDYFKMANVC